VVVGIEREARIVDDLQDGEVVGDVHDHALLARRRQGLHHLGRAGNGALQDLTQRRLWLVFPEGRPAVDDQLVQICLHG
jgi:hypothetical protein